MTLQRAAVGRRAFAGIDGRHPRADFDRVRQFLHDVPFLLLQQWDVAFLGDRLPDPSLPGEAVGGRLHDRRRDCGILFGADYSYRALGTEQNARGAPQKAKITNFV